MSTCPVPGCEHEAPGRGVFCPDHHFAMPRAYSGLVLRTKFACEREIDPDRRQHLAEQLHGYINSAIRAAGLDRQEGRDVA